MSQLRASPSASTVVGIDASLTSLGIAGRRRGEHYATALGYTSSRGIPRIILIRDAVAKWLDVYAPTLIALEGYALGFRGKSNIIFDIGELGGVLKLLILERGIDILLVPPTNLKMFVTGKGNADKEKVASVLQEELGVSYSKSDQYDATGLLLMGEAFLDSRLLPRDRTHYKRRAMAGCSLLKSIEISCK